MKIIIAPDSYKGSLSSIQVCNAIEDGIMSVFPKSKVLKLPIADGGEGTVDAFVAGTGYQKKYVTVTGPLGEKTKAAFAVDKNKTAVIEMAAASGLTLIKDEDKDPRKTTSYGTGELVKAALDLGCKKIIIGLGGSATNDGGAGLAQALGYSLKNELGEEIGYGGGALSELHTIDSTAYDRRLDECEILAACDVTNPLVGKTGASAVFGPQKGADAHMIKQLDANLLHYSEVIKSQLSADIKNIEGTGAAGGLAAGLIAFCNAKIVSGIELILDLIQFDKHVESADLVITGEGRIDYQSAYGKVPVGVAKRAKKKAVPVIAVVGSIGNGAEVIYNHGIDSIVSILKSPMSLEDAMANTSELLKDTAERTMRIVKLGLNMKR